MRNWQRLCWWKSCNKDFPNQKECLSQHQCAWQGELVLYWVKVLSDISLLTVRFRIRKLFHFYYRLYRTACTFNNTCIVWFSGWQWTGMQILMMVLAVNHWILSRLDSRSKVSQLRKQELHQLHIWYVQYRLISGVGSPWITWTDRSEWPWLPMALLSEGHLAAWIWRRGHHHFKHWWNWGQIYSHLERAAIGCR